MKLVELVIGGSIATIAAIGVSSAVMAWFEYQEWWVGLGFLLTSALLVRAWLYIYCASKGLLSYETLLRLANEMKKIQHTAFALIEQNKNLMRQLEISETALEMLKNQNANLIKLKRIQDESE